MSIYGYEAASMLINSLDDLKAGKTFNDALREAAKANQLLVGLEFDDYGDAFFCLFTSLKSIMVKQLTKAWWNEEKRQA